MEWTIPKIKGINSMYNIFQFQITVSINYDRVKAILHIYGDISWEQKDSPAVP